MSKDRHPNPEDYWRHRRNGYLFGRHWAILQTLLWVVVGMYDTGLIGALSTVVMGSYGVSMVLIGGYYGNTAVETWMSKGLR